MVAFLDAYPSVRPRLDFACIRKDVDALTHHPTLDFRIPLREQRHWANNHNVAVMISKRLSQKLIYK